MTLDTETANLLAAVGDLLPTIEAASAELGTARKLPDDLVARLADAGVLGMLLPKTLGGLEADPSLFIEVIEQLSYADGAVGWVAAIASATSGYLASRLPESVARSIWKNPQTVVCGNIAVPAGKATPVDGGYRVSGRWPFGSGSYHSEWLAGACTVQSEGVDGQAPEERVVVVPRRDCQLLDNWDVIGLRGTGSTDYVVDDVFVPADHSIDRSAGAHQNGPLYRHRFYLLGHAAHALGVARRALETFEELARVKPMARMDRVLAGKPSAQSDIAQARALVAMANAYLREVVDELWSTVTSGASLTLEQQGRARLVIISSVRNAVRAVDLVYEAAGATSIYEASPLARCFRDIHVASQHAVVQTGGYEVVGQTILGVTPRVPFVF
jgi:alkylation response protein AidB-like acyl-CoA dehydrogenase